MAFPKYSKEIDDTQIKIEHKYLVKKYELILDRMRCTGCGTCSIVCPKEAILFGPAAAVYENKPKDLNAAVVDTVIPEKCVMCGTCVQFCPFDAIHLYEDGEKVDPATMKLVEYHSIPKLEATAVHCANLGREAKVYWEGEIAITYEMQKKEDEFKAYYMNKCPGDCHKCEQICPTNAIKFKEYAEAWKTKVLMEIDEEKCIKCSACMLVCPQDNYKVKWTNVKFSGPYNKIFWDPIKDKLLKQEVVFNEPK